MSEGWKVVGMVSVAAVKGMVGPVVSMALCSQTLGSGFDSRLLKLQFSLKM